MFQRISQHLREQLGSDKVCLILADTDGKNLLLYSNKQLKGYSRNADGGYEKHAPLSSIPEEQLKDLKPKDTRFYHNVSVCTHTHDQWAEIETNVRSADYSESGILSTGNNSYGYCRTGRLARILGEKEYGGYEFSLNAVEGALAHEGTHGITRSVYDGLVDLFGEDRCSGSVLEFLDAYHVIEHYNVMPEIIEEAVATLVGIKYLESFYPEEAAHYKTFISTLETDSKHKAAFRFVLTERHRVEEMRKLTKLLVKNKDG